MTNRKVIYCFVIALSLFVLVDGAKSEVPKDGANSKAEASKVKHNNPFFGLVFKCRNNSTSPECVEFNKKAAAAKKRREAQMKFCAENPSDAECKARAELRKAREEKRKQQQELCKADPSKCNNMPFIKKFKSTQKDKE